MKKMVFAVVAMCLVLAACNEKKGLAGSEFSSSDIMAEMVDSLWTNLKQQLDTSLVNTRASVIAQFEEQMSRKLTDEELDSIDRQLDEQMKQAYADGLRQVDSLKNSAKVSAVLTFADDEHVTLHMEAASASSDDTDEMKGTYAVDGQTVVLTFPDHSDTLRLSDDGSQLRGRLGESTYYSTLTRK